MADLLITKESVTLSLSVAEKFAAIHRDVTVPRAAVASVRVAADGMREVRGFRAPGTKVPGLISAGTFRGAAGRTFAVCHGHRPALVLELHGTSFDRIVATVDDPESTARALS